MELAQCDAERANVRRSNHRDSQRVQQSNPRHRLAARVPDGICRCSRKPIRTSRCSMQFQRSDRFFSAAPMDTRRGRTPTALTVAGIERETPNPKNGIIERDAKGEASGALRETAQEIVRAVIPPMSAAEREEGLKRALLLANRIRNYVVVEAAADNETLDAYRAVDAQGALTARVVASIEVNPSNEAESLALMRPQDRGTGARLRVDSAKIFVDGVLEGETAALLQPYLDNPGFSGESQDAGRSLEHDGHGPRQARDPGAHARDWRSRSAGGRSMPSRRRARRMALPTIVITSRTCSSSIRSIDRASRELGVIANFQSLWAFPDQYITDVNLPQVGQARIDQMYPIGSTLKAGARIVGGSDWNVSSMNPLLAIETAVTRSDPTGRIAGALNESERVSLPDMLAAYTINGAYLMHQEKDTGSLEVGKAADFVVLATRSVRDSAAGHRRSCRNAYGSRGRNRLSALTLSRDRSRRGMPHRLPNRRRPYPARPSIAIDTAAERFACANPEWRRDLGRLDRTTRCIRARSRAASG